MTAHTALCRVFWISLVLALAGCAQDPRRLQLEEAQIIREIEQSCVRLGFQQETAEFQDCKLRLYQTHLEQRNRRYYADPYWGPYPYYRPYWIY